MKTLLTEYRFVVINTRKESTVPLGDKQSHENFQIKISYDYIKIGRLNNILSEPVKEEYGAEYKNLQVSKINHSKNHPGKISSPAVEVWQEKLKYLHLKKEISLQAGRRNSLQIFKYMSDAKYHQFWLWVGRLSIISTLTAGLLAGYFL